ncbi:hypothetical protein ABPG75_013298 [Micractinium tetrahymenae]
MPPRKANQAGEEAAAAAGGAPSAVLDAYAAYRSKQDDASLEALLRLVESGVAGPAACLALCKASTLHAALRAGEQQDNATEAEAAAVQLLSVTHCSPLAQARRRAAFKLLLHACERRALLDAQSAPLDPRVLPLARIAAAQRVQQGPGHVSLQERRQDWWDALRLDQWLMPEAEWVGSDRWPWELLGGASENFAAFVAGCKAAAGELRGMATDDTSTSRAGAMVEAVISLQQSSMGIYFSGATGFLEAQQQVLEAHPLYKQPLRERLARAHQLLPPDWLERLREHLKRQNEGNGEAPASAQHGAEHANDVCAAEGCSNSQGLRRCGGCRAVRYCSEACRDSHWKAHRPECRRLRAAAAAASTEGTAS